MLSDAGRDDPFSHPGSFCLPVGRKPFVGWTLGRFMLLMTCLSLALGIGGFLILFLGASLRAQGPIAIAGSPCNLLHVRGVADGVLALPIL